MDLPEPPLTLASTLRKLGTDRWGTRDRAWGLRGLGWFADEFERGDHPGDYVLAGLEDAATNAPAIQYLLVYGNLGLFVEGDFAEGRAKKLLERVDRLQRGFIAASADGLVPHLLVVRHSDFSNTRWIYRSDPPVGGMDGVKGALDWLYPIVN